MLSDFASYFKSYHAIILLTFYLSIRLSMGALDSPDPPLASRLDSVQYPDVPQLFSHDEDGNIVLNGKINGSTVFEVNFAPDWIPYGNKVQIEFCRAPGPQACNQNDGLVVCWERNGAENPFEKKAIKDPRMRQLIDTCKDMQGVMLTTEMDNGNEIFRLDTVYNNTYRFKAPPNGKKCFKLNLFGFQHFPGMKQMLEDEEDSSLKSLRKKRAARLAWPSESRVKSGLSKALDRIGLEKPLGPNDQIEGIDGNKIVMKDEELKMWAYTRPWYHLVKFKVQGGGRCCGLSAKIVGRSISKCYFTWKQLVVCRASDSGTGKNSCPYNFQIGVSPKVNYGEGFPMKPADKIKYERLFGVYLPANLTDFYPLLIANIGANLSQMIFMSDLMGKEDLSGASAAMENQMNGVNNGRKETRERTDGAGVSVKRGPEYGNPNGPNISYTAEARQLVFRCFGLEVDTDGVATRLNNAKILKVIDDWLEKNGYPVPGKPEPKC